MKITNSSEIIKKCEQSSLAFMPMGKALLYSNRVKRDKFNILKKTIKFIDLCICHFIYLWLLI